MDKVEKRNLTQNNAPSLETLKFLPDGNISGSCPVGSFVINGAEFCCQTVSLEGRCPYELPLRTTKKTSYLIFATEPGKNRYFVLGGSIALLYSPIMITLPILGP
jgi:hypothetical protein